MKKKYIAIIGILLIIAAGYAWATASSCTENTVRINNGSYSITTLTWTANSTNGGFTDYTTTKTIAGQILQVVTNPDTSTAGAGPSDSYDITLKNSDGVDIMGGALANRDTVNTEIAIPLSGSLAAPAIVNSTLVLSISNNTTTSAVGKVDIYWRAY